MMHTVWPITLALVAATIVVVSWVDRDRDLLDPIGLDQDDEP